jgi:hypothetical protein
MGYMGFGKDYQRKTKKLSNNLMYSENDANKLGQDTNATQINRERLKYQPAPIPKGLRIFRLILYRIIPLGVLGVLVSLILYDLIMDQINS